MQQSVWSNQDNNNPSSVIACWSQFGIALARLKAFTIAWEHYETASVCASTIVSTFLQSYPIV